MTLLSEVTKYLGIELNKNPQGVVFDLGYVFERDENGFTRLVDSETNQYVKDVLPFIAGMFGSFSGDFNKPLNYAISNQLSKSGSTAMLFSLPDKDDEEELYNNALAALEWFENLMTGRKNADGSLIQIVVGELTYKMLFNSAPVQVNGVVKYGAGFRPLMSLSMSISAGYNITYGDEVIHEMKEYGASDETYIKVETPEAKNGLSSTFEFAQPNGDTEAFAGTSGSVYNKQIFMYYPDSETIGKDTIIKLFRRIEDPLYKPDSRYTFRTTYPDFQAVRNFKYSTGVPNTVKGIPLSGSFSFVPYKDVE